MNIEERKTQLWDLLHTPVDRPFHEIHTDIEKVMGRPVHTHELSSTVNQYLFNELDGKATPGLIEKANMLRHQTYLRKKRSTVRRWFSRHRPAIFVALYTFIAPMYLLIGLTMFAEDEPLSAAIIITISCMMFIYLGAAMIRYRYKEKFEA